MAGNVFKKIVNAKASGGGNLIKDGKYTLEVKNLLLKDGFKGDSFIAEFLVRNAEAIEMVDGKLIQPNPVGSECSFVVNFKNESAAGNVKAFVLALLGLDEASVSGDELEATLVALVNNDPAAKDSDGDLIGVQPARGMLIGDTTYRRPIKSGANAGKPFVGNNWSRIEQAPEEIKARRAAQESGKPAQAA